MVKKYWNCERNQWGVLTVPGGVLEKQGTENILWTWTIRTMNWSCTYRVHAPTCLPRQWTSQSLLQTPSYPLINCRQHELFSFSTCISSANFNSLVTMATRVKITSYLPISTISVCEATHLRTVGQQGKANGRTRIQHTHASVSTHLRSSDKYTDAMD
jgi:hypothetical protein